MNAESVPRRLLCATNADRHHGVAVFPIGQSPARRSGSEISDLFGRARVDEVGRPFSGMPLAADNADVTICAFP